MKQNAPIRYYVNLFEGKWDKSLDRRVEACDAYAYAVNTYGIEVKAHFKDLYQTQNFKDHQWGVILGVGNEKIAPEWLDYRNTSVPLSLARNNIDLDTQYEIYEQGLDIYTLNGNIKHINASSLRVCHITQAYHEDGTPRSMEEQIRWLQDKERPNINVEEDGRIHVRSRCYITKAMLIGLLKSNPPPLTVAELREIADHNERRDAR